MRNNFHFRAILGVKEVLQSSKFSTSIFGWFFILHHSQSLKMCFRKNVSVCVCVTVCLPVWPSPNVEPKPIDRSLSNSISRILLQITRAFFFFFLVFPLPLKLRVVHIRKKIKISNFSKMVLTVLIKFCAFIVHSKPNNMTLSPFAGKIPESRKIVFNFLFVA